jgi:probable F420-dependent oxidoreductase
MNTPEELRADRMAVALEERGYDSLWIGEHTHIPASRLTPYPAGGEMPEPYKRMMDPYVALTAAAMATRDLIVGTSVALPLEADLLRLAKEISTLDNFSGGRFQFGVGCGWNVEELANHTDVTWAQRYRALEEAVNALKALWTEDDAEFHGEFFDFDPVWSYPKPVQRPHPPILCGMAGKLGTQHAVRWADAWMPMDIALGNCAKKVRLFRDAVAAAGRDPELVEITFVAFGDPSPEVLHEYKELGVVRTVVGASRQGWDDPSTTMPFIDRYATLVDELR